MVKKYRVIVQGNSVIVYNNKTGKNTVWHINNFIYGQTMYDEKTDRYPNYVHAEVWGSGVIKIKYNMKVIQAFEDGLNDGVLMQFIDTIKPIDKYYTKKESKAYFNGIEIAINRPDMLPVWQANKYHGLIKYCIDKGIIQPIESEFKLFIEEV